MEMWRLLHFGDGVKVVLWVEEEVELTFDARDGTWAGSCERLQE